MQKSAKGISAAPRLAARGLIRVYQLSLSSLIGRQCRYLPSCSAFTDEAIDRYGLWAGGWMGLSRICRCNPWGGSGFDPVPQLLPPDSGALRPWRYGQWRQSPVCEAVEPASAKTARE